VLLKFAEARKAENADDTNHGGGVGVEALGHVAHAEKHEAAGMFENRAKHFLPLGGQLAEAFLQIDRLRRRDKTFHEDAKVSEGPG